MKPLDVWICSVTEVNPPSSEEAINWVLLTNFPVETIEEACEKVSWYKLRWRIELYFKVLKSGFRIENARLNHFKKLEKFIILCAILATRVMNLSYYARSKLEIVASYHFTKLELKVLRMSKRASDPEPKSLKNAIILLAKLGGYLNRKNDGPPGIVTIWRGLSRLAESCDLYQQIEKSCV